MRINRKKAIESKICQCPTAGNDESYTRVIEEARDNLGDWKLQSSTSYKVPLDRQVNLRKKLEEMIFFTESIYKKKTSFNSKLLLLQKERLQLLIEIEKKKNRIKEIKCNLGNSDSRGLMRHIDNQQVLGKLPSVESTSYGIHEIYKVLPQVQDIPSSVPIDVKALSEIELNEMNERKILLKFELLTLSADIKRMVSNFDDSVYKLRRERFQLVLESKAGEIQLAKMFLELELLKMFEETDEILRGKLDDHEQEKLQVRRDKCYVLARLCMLENISHIFIHQSCCNQ